ncbi:thiamine phosphate synthase [Mucilaginibacter sp. HMF5004]|uniref:thiamine phosphate synthase n=1 Tax=Mucilaginibacter rivuli TaxID=2857527 RepID=UPI001C5FAA0C|nr:thiamine phosphate synthase [Mucilaginibacter rivuli]MBW4889381.1 thiamine phosphate synthase [Mucilaginibacter rivuli]
MEMINDKKAITGGVYLVLDPGMDRPILLDKLKAALQGGLQVIQIWNNWPEQADKLSLISDISRLCKQFKIPLLINEDWTLLKHKLDLNGVHFDNIPANIEQIKAEVGRPFIMGITCSDSLAKVEWAHHNRLDYISFCSMFPSPSAGSCDIVMPETVRQARKLTDIPIFISGGITPENTKQLKSEIPFNGVAVISGVLSAEYPDEKVKLYHDALGQ